MPRHDRSASRLLNAKLHRFLRVDSRLHVVIVAIAQTVVMPATFRAVDDRAGLERASGPRHARELIKVK